MFGNRYFQIRHGASEELIVGEFVATGAINRGTVMNVTTDESIDPTTVTPANGESLGFMSQNMTLAGPTIEQQFMQVGDLPLKSGSAVSLRKLVPGSLIEVENEPSLAYDASTGAQLLVTGSTTGYLTTSTAKNVNLSVKNGRWYVAQTGDRIIGRLVSQLTPVAAATNVRILIEILAGGKA